MFSAIKNILLIFSFLVLIATNILTLTNTAFNAFASGLMNTAFSLLSSVADTSNLKTVNDKHKNALASKDKKIAKQKTALASNKKAAKRIGSNITTRTKRLAVASIAAIPAESIPLIGIGTVVAITAYELTTSCQNLNDINELYASLDMTDEIETGVMNTVCNPQLPDVATLWRSFKTKDSQTPSDYEGFQQTLSGSINAAVIETEEKKTNYDDSLKGTIENIFKNWGWE